MNLYLACIYVNLYRSKKGGASGARRVLASHAPSAPRWRLSVGRVNLTRYEQNPTRGPREADASCLSVDQIITAWLASLRQLLHRTTSPAPLRLRRVLVRTTPAPAQCARRGRPRRGRTRQHASATRTAHGPGVRRGIEVLTSSGGEPAKVQPGSPQAQGACGHTLQWLTAW